MNSTDVFTASYRTPQRDLIVATIPISTIALAYAAVGVTAIGAYDEKALTAFARKNNWELSLSADDQYFEERWTAFCSVVNEAIWRIRDVLATIDTL
jgi:hypothetical protein